MTTEETNGETFSGKKQLLRKRVKDANKLNANAFSCNGQQNNCSSSKMLKSKQRVTIESMIGSSLSSSDFQWAKDLFQNNMKEMYQQSDFGFDMVDKEAEMTASTSRYLIAKISDSEESGGKLAGFCHYRFDMDFGCPVVYCYELQIESKYQGCGLGRELIEVLEMIAKKTHMLKVSATVFKFNTASEAFFRKLGFVNDPDAFLDPDCDYYILCKFVM